MERQKTDKGQRRDWSKTGERQETQRQSNETKIDGNKFEPNNDASECMNE